MGLTIWFSAGGFTSQQVVLAGSLLNCFSVAATVLGPAQGLGSLGKEQGESAVKRRKQQCDHDGRAAVLEGLLFSETVLCNNNKETKNIPYLLV